MQKELGKESKGETNILENLKRKKRVKKVATIAIITILLVIVSVFIVLLLTYFKSPEKQIGIGANIESALLNEQGNLVYVKLLGGSLDKNITKIKFIFTDFLGEEHYYETSEGIQQIEVPFKRSFWDWLFRRQFTGVYDYEINADELNLDNFENINEVSVSFEYKTEEGEVIETPKLDTTKTTTKTTTTGGGGNGGNGGTTTPGCPPKTCADYPGQCGSDLSDGCGSTINCNDNCNIDEICVNGSCEINPCYNKKCSDYNETECEINECLSCRWENGECDEIVYYVRADATGNNDGSDWTNAFSELPDILVRGATYFIADGIYGGHTFNDAEQNDSNGNPLYITIKKAIQSDHGTDVGWQASYGDGVANWVMDEPGERLIFFRSYYVFDGQVGGGPGSWDSGHGFKVYLSPRRQDYRALFLLGNKWLSPYFPSFLEIKHVEMTSPDRVPGDTDYAIQGSNGKNITLSYNYIHDIFMPMNIAFMQSWTVEYNYIARNDCDPPESNQGTMWQDWGSNDMVVRYNVFEDIDGTAALDLKKNNYDNNSGWEIYGNVFWYTPDNDLYYGFGGPGVIGDAISTDPPAEDCTTSNMKVYNNAFVNLKGGNTGISFNCPIHENNKVYNNIWYNSTTLSHSNRGDRLIGHDHDYNIYINTPWSRYMPEPSEHDVYNISGDDPFVDWQNLDFRLKEPTAPGVYFDWMDNRDMFGNIRGEDGVWDRGAIEYVEPPIENNNLTQFGITWFFDKPLTTEPDIPDTYQYGTFANGDYWVVAPDGRDVVIVSITPESDKTVITGTRSCAVSNLSNCTEYGGGEVSCVSNVCNYNRTINGAMKNPNPILYQQGYDSSSRSVPYNESLNVARKNNSFISVLNTLEVPANSSLISSISLEYTHLDYENRQGYVLRIAAILTILDSAPASGSFRPPYTGTDKTIKFNESQLNYRLLGTLNKKDFATSSILKMNNWTDAQGSSAERMVHRPWIQHIGLWSGEVISPLDNMLRYPGYRTRQLQTIAMLLNVDWTGSPGFESNDQYKRNLLVSTVQLGIDTYGIYQAGAKTHWIPDGGHGIGRKWPILFAGVMLEATGAHPDAAAMANIGFNDHDDPHFSEDDQSFYANQANLDAQNALYYGQYPERKWADSEGVCDNTSDPDHCRGSCGPDIRSPFHIPYTQDDVDNKLPEWGIRYATHIYMSNRAWGVNYRKGQTNANYPGLVLSMHIMGLKDKWNHNSFFDYMDRYIAIEKEIKSKIVAGGGSAVYAGYIWDNVNKVIVPVEHNIPGTPDTDIHGNVVNEKFGRHFVSSSAFAENMWDEYRSQYGCFWQYDNITNINSGWHYNCSDCLYNCLESPYCGDGNCDTDETSDNCEFDCEVEGQVYYVSQLDPNCNDAYTLEQARNPATPWCNISTTCPADGSYIYYFPIRNIPEGSTVIVKEGNYIFGEDEHSNCYDSFPRSQWTTYKAENGENVVFDKIIVSKHAQQDSYLIFDGFNITDGVTLQDTAYIKILNCTIQTVPLDIEGFYAPYFLTNRKAVATVDAHYITIQGNEISNAYRGIGASGSNFLIKDNIIHHISEDGMDLSSVRTDSVVEGNYIYDHRPYTTTQELRGEKTGAFIEGEVVYMEEFPGITGIVGRDDAVSVWVYPLTETTFYSYEKTGKIVVGQDSNATIPLTGDVDPPHTDSMQLDTSIIITGLVIRNNIFDRKRSGGIGTRDGQGLKIWGYDNNIISPIIENNVIVGGGAHLMQGLKDAKFNNNTILSGQGLSFRTQASNSTVSEMFNNIVERLRLSDDGRGYTISIQNHGNNIFGNNPNGMFDFTTTTTEIVNYNVSSLFVDLVNSDFHPLMSSPACNGSINPPGIAVGALPCVCTNDTQCEEVFGSEYICDAAVGNCCEDADSDGVCDTLPTFSPLTKLWNFLKGLLTRETGKAILTGKITGNAVDETGEDSKVPYIILSLFVVMMLIIIIMIVKIKKNKEKAKKKFGKKIKRR